MPTSSPPPLRLLERPPHRRERMLLPARTAPVPTLGRWAARLRRAWLALRVPA